MNKTQIVGELNSLINKGNDILKNAYPIGGNGMPHYTMLNKEQFESWRVTVISFLDTFIESNSEFFVPFKKKGHEKDTLLIDLETLKNIKEYTEKEIVGVSHSISIDYDETLNVLFSRFHKIVRQLRNRYSNRPTLDVNDEYDVQDLLHSLLHIYFEDIRPEEWTPSYAGRSSRTDFLLKNEKIFVEVKKTRKGLADKELGEQLTLDISKYKGHPDCEKLYCFVYDPEGRIVNKNGIISDLESTNGDFVKVIIKPD